jgi:uncharacterized membrane protein YjjP (DUF1212 family)
MDSSIKIDKQLEIELILLLSKILQKNGIPAHRMEEAFFKICNHFKIEGDVFSSPNGLMINIGEKQNPKTFFIKAPYGELNFEKLDNIDRIYQKIVDGNIEIPQAIKELNLIETTKKRYRSIIEILFFAISTSSAARLFGGGYAEILVSFVIGLFIGLLIDLTEKIPALGRVLIVTSSVFAIMFAKLSVMFLGNYSVDIATITGLIILIPGFSFTVSIIELVNGHAIAGTARFANTLVTLLMIGLGIGVGSQIDKIITIVPAVVTMPAIPDWTILIALFTVPLGFVVLFKAIPKDFVWILLGCWCSYFSLKFGAMFNSVHLSVFIASFLLGLSSNIFGKLISKPISIMLVPGIILLVPGSLGFQSISNLVDNQTLKGVESAFSMTITAVSLVAGLVLSNIINPSKKSF